jgi:hypothetical protein
MEIVQPWPMLPPGSTRRTRAMEALFEVTGAPVPRGQSEARAGSATRVLRVICLPSEHRQRRGGAPTLGEVWQTSHGLLFLATAPTRWDASEGVGGLDSAEQVAASALTEEERSTLPAVLVLVLIDEADAPSRLFVRCRKHRGMTIDTRRLRGEAARGADAPRRCADRVVTVDRVGPLL